jgi:hypothetical protein
MMHCREFEEIFITQIYGKSVPSQMDALRSHIKDCPGCAREYERILHTCSRFERKEDVPAPDWEKSWKVVLEGATKRKRVRVRYTTYPRLAFAGAAMIVVFILGLFAGRQFFFPKTQERKDDVRWVANRDLSLDTYAERIDVVLINFLNRSHGMDREEFAEFEKKVIADMLDQTRLLKNFHSQEKDPQLIILLNEIECILMSISNLRSDDLESAEQLDQFILQRELNQKLQELSKNKIMS